MFGISVIYIITRFLKVVKCDVNYKKEEKKCKFLCFVPCIVVKDIFQEEKGGDTVDDSDIVKLFLERNEQALSETSAKYRRYCFSIALNIAGSEEDAEECVNDTLMKVWDMIPPHKPQTLSTFLGKIVRNVAIDRHRMTLSEKRGGGESEMAFDELAEIIPDGRSVESDAERKELLNEINAFIGKLPANKRNIFMCRYWYCDSIAKIAQEFGISEGNVSVILNRVRHKLKEYLKKRGY